MSEKETLMAAAQRFCLYSNITVLYAILCMIAGDVDAAISPTVFAHLFFFLSLTFEKRAKGESFGIFNR